MNLIKFLKQNQDITHEIIKNDDERSKFAKVFKVTPEKLYLMAGLCIDFNFVPNEHPKTVFKTRFTVWDGLNLLATTLVLVAAMGSML